MCLWVRDQHPICGHALPNEPPQLIRCPLGQDCLLTEFSADTPLLVPNHFDGTENCGGDGCAYAIHGPVWCCCKCGAVNHKTTACRACQVPVCLSCSKVER